MTDVLALLAAVVVSSLATWYVCRWQYLRGRTGIAPADPTRRLQDQLKVLLRTIEAESWGREDVEHLPDRPDFRAVVASLREKNPPEPVLINLAREATSPLVALAAMEALSAPAERPTLWQDLLDQYRMGDELIDPILWVGCLRLCRRATPQPDLAALFYRWEWWDYHPVKRKLLKRFLRDLAEEGIPLTFGEELPMLQRQLDDDRFTDLLNDLLPESAPLLAEWKLNRPMQEVDLPPFFRELKPGTGMDHEIPSRVASRAALAQRLLGSEGRSVLLVGRAGVGKMRLLERLAAEHPSWTFVQAGATEIMAGQSFIGQVEQRIQDLVMAVHGKPIVWVIPRLQEMIWAGRYTGNATGVLERLLPSIVEGTVRVVGLLEPAAHERLITALPAVREAFEVLRLPPCSAAEARAFGTAYVAARLGTPLETTLMDEALNLAAQYLNDRAAPGNLLWLLRDACRRVEPTGRNQLTRGDLFASVTALSGLPAELLDEHVSLDLDALRDLFERRVMGQPEATRCLVERVAMIKAGLTDPDRPNGVFLFVGPTGTGKTEIAKTLASFLFGSPDRMIRLDMSEYQGRDSLGLLLGTPEALDEDRSLTRQIRQQPFSVVLLDEFEKAHPLVWDLFLQVFDDGRLTDARGNPVDFRHAVIILTSNLGAAVPSGTNLGFNGTGRTFSTSDVEKALKQTFRPEFLNRIDRVVYFRPLSRAVMRRILMKELDDVLTRQGLRNRAWAVEWEASAIEFLLEKGFTPNLGARPLKRAIERYLLTPLALTIVEHEAPEGDQFLFVRSDGEGLEVAFVDPDAPDEPATPPARDGEIAHPVRALALDACGLPEEVDRLAASLETLESYLDERDWDDRKAALLARTSETGFWASSERFGVLGEAEYMDRIESGIRFAGRLLDRLLGRDGAGRKAYPRKLVLRLAEQLYLLETACRGWAEGMPRDALLAVHGTARKAAEPTARLVEMYRSWGRLRRMRTEELPFSGADPGLLMTVSGFGAYPILASEDGLHVFEVPRSGHGYERVSVRVKVVPLPEEPPPQGTSPTAWAEALLDGHPAKEGTIVRRYRLG